MVNKQRNSLRTNQVRHLNGAKFGSALDQFRAKTAMAGVCNRFAFVTATTIEDLKKLLQKRKHCKKHRFLALCLEEVVLREENYR